MFGFNLGFGSPLKAIAFLLKFTNTATVSSSFASPAAIPTGLTFDGTNLISCDYGTDIIYIHDGVTATILSSFASPAAMPFGLTFDGTNLISCDAGSDLIHIHG
jgi:hypothetical protein